MSANLKFIGQITTPYQTIEACPNNIELDGPLCQLNLNPEYQDELAGLAAGQHILFLYWLGKPQQPSINSKPAADKADSGIFALRTPFRPNPIGAATLPIEKMEAGRIWVRGLDCLNHTPLLDIKPAIYLETSNP